MVRIRNFAAALSLLGLLGGLGPAGTAVAGNGEVRAGTQNIATRSDHEMVAKYYEDAAGEARAKLDEQKQLLEQYENRSYLYGRQAQDLQAQTDAMIRKLERTVDENIKQAALHRKLAQRLPDLSSQKLSSANAPDRKYTSPE